MRTARRNRAPFLVFAFALALVVALLGGVTPASATGSTLTLNQASYVQGQTITASYSTASVSSTNWIGLYYSDSTPGQVSSLQWKYAPNSSGQVTFSTSALSPGSYRAYYLYNNGYTSLTDSVFFTILGTAVTTTPGTKSCAAPTAANLLQDGDSECATASASGYDDITVPGWTQTGVPSVVGYTVGNGFPGPSTPGPADRGNQFLSGGPVGDSTLTQSVDLSSAAVLIDTGVVTFSLSGWLGGYSSEASSTTVTAAFLNAQGATLGSGQIGPVTHTDRGNATKLLQRTATAAVPAGTRSAQIVVHLNGDPARNANNQYNDAYADSLSFSISVPVTVPSAPVPPAASVPGFDHVFFVMLENKSYDQVIGSASAPYLNQLAAGGATLGQSYGAIHPSDPNYIAVAGGSTFGHVDNPVPGAIGTLNASNLPDLAESAGKTWGGYIEDMNSPCNLQHNGYFDPDNLPFLYFKDIANNPSRCLSHIKPITSLWSDLGSTSTTPNLVWFEPNTCNTMHSCSVATGDTWMSANLPRLFASPAWTSQRSLLVITFDEDDTAHGQHIPSIVVGSQGTVKSGFVSPAHYTHYSMTRTIEAGLGLGTLTQNDAFAAAINDIWQ